MNYTLLLIITIFILGTIAAVFHQPLIDMINDKKTQQSISQDANKNQNEEPKDPYAI